MSYYPEWDSRSLWNGRGDTDIYRPTEAEKRFYRNNKTNKDMDTLKKLKQEHTELTDKLERLTMTLDSGLKSTIQKFGPKQASLLYSQKILMEGYVVVLKHRIDNLETTIKQKTKE